MRGQSSSGSYNARRQTTHIIESPLLGRGLKWPVTPSLAMIQSTNVGSVSWWEEIGWLGIKTPFNVNLLKEGHECNSYRVRRVWRTKGFILLVVTVIQA